MIENEKRFARRVLKFCDVAAFFILVKSVWIIDIAVSTLLTSNTVATNGFTQFNPAQMYHIGLWGVLAGGVWLVLRALEIVYVEKN